MSADLFQRASAVLRATLGACGLAALDAGIHGGLRPRWEPHADGVVSCELFDAPGLAVARRSTRGVHGEALALVVALPAGRFTLAEMRDWDLSVAWPGGVPAGYERLALRDGRGRRVTVIAPGALLPPLASYFAYMMRVFGGVALGLAVSV